MKKLLMVLVFCVSCASPRMNHGIPNLAQVEPGIWRGGQPNAEGWAYLKSLGVNRSIKLNPVSEGSDVMAESNSIAVVYLPIDWSEQLILKPDAGTVYYAVQAVTNGTYIHCLHGQDRTGLIVGVYRVNREGWSKAVAREEMRTNGFHAVLFGLSRYWWEEVK